MKTSFYERIKMTDCEIFFAILLLAVVLITFFAIKDSFKGL